MFILHSGRMNRFGIFLLLSTTLLGGVRAVGPGGDVLEEGCEEYDPHSKENETERFEILTVNYHEVRTPLAIGIWILIAAVAKVCEYSNVRNRS